MTWWDWLRSLFHRPAPVPTPTPTPTPTPMPVEADLYDEINAARMARGLPGLLHHGTLDMIATMRAERNRARNYTGLDGHMGVKRDLEDRFPAQATGECVAAGQRTAEEVVLDWIEDQPHREIMLGKFRYVGCGRSGAFWVADFLSS